MVATRHYRITPWPVRVLVPFIAFVVVLAVIADRTAPAVVVPIVVVLAGAYIYAAERSGLYVTDRGIESRMTRRGDSFRFSWADVDHFELLEGTAQLAIVVYLADGKRVILPSTKAWMYDRRSVEQIYDQLTRDLAAARHGRTRGD